MNLVYKIRRTKVKNPIIVFTLLCLKKGLLINMNTIFEVGMLVCFGLAWPADIYKSFKSKTSEGKSILFLDVVLLGYISGIIHKIINSRDYVLILYIINFVLVAIDIILYYVYKNNKSKM